MAEVNAPRESIGGSGIVIDDALSMQPDAALASRSSQYSLETPFRLLLIVHRIGETLEEVHFVQASPLDIFDFAFEAKEGLEMLRSLPLHSHDFYELMISLEGDTFQNIEYRRHFYPEGCACLMNRSIRHQEEYEGDQSVVFLQLSRSYLQQLLSRPSYFVEDESLAMEELGAFIQSGGDLHDEGRNCIDFKPAGAKGQAAKHVGRILDDIMLELLSPRVGSSRRVDAWMLELFETLFADSSYEKNPVSFGNKTERELFDEVSSILVARHGRASRHELVERLHYSGDYLYKVVRKFTGLSLSEYGMKICMEEAARMLRADGVTVREVMVALGFSNQTQFYNAFRRFYGTSPAKWRRALPG